MRSARDISQLRERYTHTHIVAATLEAMRYRGGSLSISLLKNKKKMTNAHDCPRQ